MKGWTPVLLLAAVTLGVVIVVGSQFVSGTVTIGQATVESSGTNQSSAGNP